MQAIRSRLGLISRFRFSNKGIEHVEPKWMRFFKGFQPLQVNIERSLLNENVINKILRRVSFQLDLLNTHVRGNYKQFTFSQLVLTLDKLSKPDVSNLLRNELLRRVICQDIDELNISKEALIALMTSLKLQNDKDLFQQVIMIYGHRMFDSLTLKQQFQLLSFIQKQGYACESLEQELQINISKIDMDELVSQMELSSLLTTLGVCQQLSTTDIIVSLSNQVEEQIYQTLSNVKTLHLHSQNFTFVKPTRIEVLESMIQIMTLALDNNYYGLFRPSKLTADQVLQIQQDIMLSDSMGSQHREFLQRLIILQGLMQKKNTDFMIRSQYAKIQQKFQTYNQVFCNLWLKDSLSIQYSIGRQLNEPQEENSKLVAQVESYIKDRIQYFYNINAKDIFHKHSLLIDLRNQFEIFQINNLGILKSYINLIQKNQIQRHMQLVLIEQPPLILNHINEYLRVLNDSTQEESNQMELKDDLVAKFESLRLQQQLLGYRITNINLESQAFFQPLQQMVTYLTAISMIVLHYPNERTQEFIQQIEFLWTSKTFKSFVEQYGMYPNLMEKLIIIQQSLNLNLQSIIDVQEKLSQILNKHQSNPQLLIESIEQDSEQYRPNIILRNQYYQEYSTQERWNSEIFSINDPSNYYLKIFNNPILQKIAKHSPLKQIIRDSLGEEWTMNVVQYPAMADFLNEESRVVLFVIDESRLMMGVSEIIDHNTQLSKAFYTNLGYQVISIDYQVYSIKRSEIKTRIDTLIQK